jgi:hypothetical protein
MSSVRPVVVVEALPLRQFLLEIHVAAIRESWSADRLQPTRQANGQLLHRIVQWIASR